MKRNKFIIPTTFVDGIAHLLLQYELTKEGNLLKIWKNDVTKKASKGKRVAKK